MSRRVAPANQAASAAINKVRAAFEKLRPLAWKDAYQVVLKGENNLSAEAFEKKFKCDFEHAVQHAVHDVAPLFNPAAIPPAEFRTANRVEAKKRRRRMETQGTFVALVCRMHYERITHEAATVRTRKEPPHEPYGRFYNLVSDVFAALDLRSERGKPMSPENRARTVCKTLSVMGDPTQEMPTRRRTRAPKSR